ncbi:unnamed protein product, partial [Oppiella nova]
HQNEGKVFVDKLPIESTVYVEPKSAGSRTERVFHFHIDGQQNYSTDKELPKLLSPQKWSQLKGRYLKSGFDECLRDNKLIAVYEDYWHQKWLHFLNAIDENALITKHKPQFVSFGGPVADIMATRYDNAFNWTVTALMVKGTIYLLKTGPQRSTSFEYNDWKYSALNMYHMITDRDDNRKNEYEKHFAINCLDVESHRLLTLNEVRAVDDKHREVDLKISKPARTAWERNYFTGKKLLRFWCKGWVQGMDRVVVANIHKQNNYKVLDVEARDVSRMLGQSQGKWSDRKCIEFLNSFLTFVKTCITDENTVYEFDYKTDREFVECKSYTKGSDIQSIDTLLRDGLKISD